LADSGWIAVAGAAVGGSLTGAIALFQTRSQRRFDTLKIREDRKWSEQVTAKEQDHVEMTRRRDELVQIYTRYQLAADRLENAVRELAEARRSGTFDEAADLHDTKMEAFEAAQTEYDKVCELVKLVAPSETMKVTHQQRQLFNRFVIDALSDTYDHEANYNAIVEAADPVLSAMRSDLRSPE
jgi:hypothetical protein